MPRLLLMYSNAPPSEGHVARLRALGDEVEVTVATDEASAVEAAPHAEVVLGHRYLRQVLPAADRLDWVQSTAAGVDHLLSPGLQRRRPLLTRCPVFADVVAHHAFALMAALVRRIPEAVRAQSEGRWASPFEMLAWPNRATVLGLGAIGRELAALLQANGMHVAGVTPDGRAPGADCDVVHAVSDWRVVLPSTDALFITIPGTPKNRHFVDRAALASLPGHAVVVNISRGSVLETGALLELLRDGRLGGAGLDVVDPMPNAADDPLWTTPRLLITPKVSVYMPGRRDRLEAFIEEQVRRYLSGDGPAYEVPIPV